MNVFRKLTRSILIYTGYLFGLFVVVLASYSIFTFVHTGNPDLNPSFVKEDEVVRIWIGDIAGYSPVCYTITKNSGEEIIITRARFSLFRGFLGQTYLSLEYSRKRLIIFGDKISEKGNYSFASEYFPSVYQQLLEHAINNIDMKPEALYHTDLLDGTYYRFYIKTPEKKRDYYIENLSYLENTNEFEGIIDLTKKIIGLWSQPNLSK